MNKKYLFCDVDETIVGLKTMFSFHDYWFKKWIPSRRNNIYLDPQSEFDDINAIILTLRQQGVSREELNRRYYEFFIGRSMTEIKECVQAWFQDTTAAQPNFWIKETCAEIRRFQALGFEVVFVSGSFIELLQPIAQVFGVEHILATKLVTSEDVLTGRFVLPQMIGAGKATAIAMFVAQHEARSEACYAMGDDYSDIPMLEAVGHAIAVIGNKRLAEYAAQRKWKTITLESTQETA